MEFERLKLLREYQTDPPKPKPPEDGEEQPLPPPEPVEGEEPPLFVDYM